MNNALLFIGAVLVVTLAALFAVPHFIDWNAYRGTFESQASRLIGRDVRVGGRVSMRLLPAPYVSFENVRVADPDGRFSEPPLRVDAFTLWLSIPPLLRGAVEASEVDLRRPEFLLRMQEPKSGESAGATAPVSGLPMSIALRSVSVHDGVVRVINPEGAETIKLEKLTGEFSAPSLEGPFRFHGTLLHSGRERELRIATGKIEPGGALTVDGTMRVAEQASAYQFKGRVKDLGSSPEFLGEMTVKPTAERGTRSQQTAQGGKDDLLPFYEIKSKLRLAMTFAQLDELAILFEQAGRPQMLSGSASARFGEDTSVSAALDARWLDLDKISAVEDKAGPMAGLARLGAMAQAWLPAGVTASVRVGVEQATLGADTIHHVELAVDQKRDIVRVSRFAAELPGGGRIVVAGTLMGLRGGANEPAAFEGPFQMRGQNLNRFLAWIAPGNAPRMEDGVGSFSLAGDLALGKDRVALTRMRGEIVATAFQGDASLGRGARPDLSLTLDSDRLDLRPLMSGGLKLADVARAVLGDKPQIVDAASSGPARKAEPTAADRYAALNSDLRLRVGRLLLPEIELRDLVGDVNRTESSTTVRALRFTTANGLKFQTDGQLLTNDGRQRGALKTLIDVETPAALAMLVRFIDLPEADVLDSRAAELMPLRLASILTIGGRGGPGFELVLDGSAQDTRTSILARVDQEPALWRTGVLDLTGTLENAKSSRLLAQLLPGTAPLSLGAADKARLSVRANGVVKTGISTAIELESKAVEAGFSGLIALPGDKATMTGEIGLKSADIADSLRLAGLKSVRALQGRDLVLHARVSVKGDEIQIADTALRFGSASVEAQGRIKRMAGRLDVDLKAKSNEASLPAILAIAMGTTQGTVPGAQGDVSVWPEDAIDFSALGDVGGKVRLEAATLALGQALGLQRAVIEAEFSPGAVDVKSLTGDALGGRVLGNARADKAAAGITVKGVLKLDGLRLDQIVAGPGAAPAATGSASGAITFNGRGLTPRGIIASLTGQGSLQLKDTRIARFGPDALDAAIAQALPPAANDAEPTEVKLEPGIFKSVIEDALSKVPLVLGNRTVPLELADGTIRAKAFVADVPRGRVKAASFLDLAAVRIDSEWTIETLGRLPVQTRSTKPSDTAAVKPGGVGSSTLVAAPVPAVSLMIAGPLGSIASLEPRINTDALARELLVRRMENDLEALERARKRKEDADRLDGEKWKAGEAGARGPVEAPDSPAPRAQEKIQPGASGGGGAAIVPTPVPVAPPTGSGSETPAAGAGAAAAPADTAAGVRPDGVGAGEVPAAGPRPKSEASRPNPPPLKGNRSQGIFEQSRGL